MTNNVTYDGKVVSAPVFSHETNGRNYYAFYMSCTRKSGTDDVIPVIIKSSLIEKFPIIKGDKIRITGRFQSKNTDDGKLLLYLKAFNVKRAKKRSCKNDVILEGIICKPTSFRSTKSGKPVCDLILKNISDSDNATYYIPCICWYSEALKGSLYEVGTKITVTGRLQSRQYIKIDDDKHKTIKIAYELSVKSIMEV